MLLSRDDFISALFRETDRAQRTKLPLTLIQLSADGEHPWLDRDELLERAAGEIAERLERMLRSYDLLGQAGPGSFLIALPGCDLQSAASLAARIRPKVFGVPFDVDGVRVNLRASFGIAASRGRSPLVMMRDAEDSLKRTLILESS